MGTVCLCWVEGRLFDDAAVAVGDEVGEVGYVFACALRLWFRGWLARACVVLSLEAWRRR